MSSAKIKFSASADLTQAPADVSSLLSSSLKVRRTPRARLSTCSTEVADAMGALTPCCATSQAKRDGYDDDCTHAARLHVMVDDLLDPPWIVHKQDPPGRENIETARETSEMKTWLQGCNPA